MRNNWLQIEWCGVYLTQPLFICFALSCVSFPVSILIISFVHCIHEICFAHIFSYLNISRNKKYIRNLQITCFKMVHNLFTSWEFDIFRPFKKAYTLPKGPVKLMQRVKIAHSFLHSMSNMFHFIILILLILRLSQPPKVFPR